MDWQDRVRKVREMVKYYEQLGVNPLSLATGCAVKVDLVRVVYPAIRQVRPELERKGLKIAPREDADIFPRPSEGVELHRKIYNLGPDTNVNPAEIAKLGPSRAIVLVQVYQGYADKPESFLEKVLPVYERIAESGVEIYMGKGHSIVTPFRNDEFMLIDFIRLLGGRPEGYTVANNDTIHIIDPTRPPTDYKQVAGGIGNALNDLFVLGAHENIRIALTVNAPTDDVRSQLLANAERFARSIGAEVLDVPLPDRGRLLIGATVLADMHKHPPTFYDRVEPGMKLIATRPFGELAPINVYLATVIDEEFVKILEARGISFDELEKTKERAVDYIARPNREAARVISKYLPESREDYRSGEHIVATTDVTGPGIYVVRELAEQMNARIKLYDVPLLFPEYAELAASYFILLNATSGTNGGYVIVAPEQVADDIVRDLKAAGYQPRVFGEVEAVGQPEVLVPSTITKYVKDEKVLEKLRLYDGGKADG
jgi:selenophosphate synthase